MFKKHSIQMKMVKDATPPATDPVEDYTSKLIATSQEADNFVKSTVKAAVTVIAVKTASEIALHVIKTYVK